MGESEAPTTSSWPKVGKLSLTRSGKMVKILIAGEAPASRGVFDQTFYAYKAKVGEVVEEKRKEVTVYSPPTSSGSIGVCGNE